MDEFDRLWAAVERGPNPNLSVDVTAPARAAYVVLCSLPDYSPEHSPWLDARKIADAVEAVVREQVMREMQDKIEQTRH